MRRHDDTGEVETINRRRRKAVQPALDDGTSVPVLLTLSAFVLRPAESRDLADQAGKDDRDRRQESAPMAVGTACMHATAIRAAPALDPQGLGDAIEIPADVAVPQEPTAAEARTPRRPRLRIELVQT